MSNSGCPIIVYNQVSNWITLMIIATKLYCLVQLTPPLMFSRDLLEFIIGMKCCYSYYVEISHGDAERYLESEVFVNGGAVRDCSTK